jgi:uncharacterized membrane protein
VKPFRWFGIIVLYTVLTLLFVYTIPNDSAFSVFSYVFGFVFVAFIPGYCLAHLLFAAKEKKLDLVEEAVLSVALSFSIAGLSGLFLGLSPIGISFDSIRLSLSPIVVILAFAAFLRKRKLRESQSQSTDKVSS